MVNRFKTGIHVQIREIQNFPFFHFLSAKIIIPFKINKIASEASQVFSIKMRHFLAIFKHYEIDFIQNVENDN